MSAESRHSIATLTGLRQELDDPGGGHPWQGSMIRATRRRAQADFRGLRSLGFAGVILAAVVAAGCDREEASELDFPDLPAPVEPRGATAALELEFVQDFGDLDEGLSFGRILGMAVSSDGLLAVVDAADCRIWWIDTMSGEYRTTGGCGDGPGEFLAPTRAAFMGDTLVVHDAEQSSLTLLTREGVELSRVHLPLLNMGVSEVSDMDIGTEGSFVLGLHLLPGQFTARNHHVVVLSGPDLEVQGERFETPPYVESIDYRARRPGSSCVSHGADGDMLVVAVNPWGPQIAVAAGNNLRPHWSVNVPVPWAGPREIGTGPGGGFMHMDPTPQAACGDRYVIAGYRDQGMTREGVLEVRGGAMVLLDLRDGSLTVLGGDEPPPEGSFLFMTPAAATGDRFFFYTNGFFGYPVIREYRIVGDHEDT